MSRAHVRPSQSNMLFRQAGMKQCSQQLAALPDLLDGVSHQPLQPGTSSTLQLALLAHMHIELHICKISEPARDIIVLLDKGSQRLQGILDVLPCT